MWFAQFHDRLQERVRFFFVRVECRAQVLLKLLKVKIVDWRFTIWAWIIILVRILGLLCEFFLLFRIFEHLDRALLEFFELEKLSPVLEAGHLGLACAFRFTSRVLLHDAKNFHTLWLLGCVQCDAYIQLVQQTSLTISLDSGWRVALLLGIFLCWAWLRFELVYSYMERRLALTGRLLVQLFHRDFNVLLLSFLCLCAFIIFVSACHAFITV